MKTLLITLWLSLIIGFIIYITYERISKIKIDRKYCKSLKNINK